MCFESNSPFAATLPCVRSEHTLRRPNRLGARSAPVRMERFSVVIGSRSFRSTGRSKECLFPIGRAESTRMFSPLTSRECARQYISRLLRHLASAPPVYCIEAQQGSYPLAHEPSEETATPSSAPPTASTVLLLENGKLLWTITLHIPETPLISLLSLCRRACWRLKSLSALRTRRSPL